MKIHCISDTHLKHGFVNFEENIDMVIFAGDAGTTKEVGENANNLLNFIEWFKYYPAKYKIAIPGNHDKCIEKGLVTKDDFYINGIKLLIHESINIEGINIFGSPYTPTFGTGWAYNVDRGKLTPYWEQIPENTDILVTHGPPYGILDITTDYNTNALIHVGDKELKNRIKEINPKYHIFGHIHNESNVINAGIFKPSDSKTTYINASVLNLRYEYCNNGIIIDI